MNATSVWIAVGCLMLAGCAAPEQIAREAASEGRMAAQSTGEATAQTIGAVGSGAATALGTAGEATAAVARGIGEAASAMTGGEQGLSKGLKDAADDVFQKRKSEFMGNEVTIDPAGEKKIRMEF